MKPPEPSKDTYARLLAEAVMHADDEIGELRARATEQASIADALSAELARERDEHAACAAQLAAYEAECRQLRIDLAGVTGSLSWRLTTPLRVAAAWARALRGRA